MAHLGVFTLKKTDGYQKLEDVIKQQITDFSFENEKKYLVSFSENCLFCAKEQEPKEQEGFPRTSDAPVEYIHLEGSTLWVKPLRKTLLVNIAE